MGWLPSRPFEPKWFHDFSLLVKIVDKTALSNSIFKFNSGFLSSFQKFVSEIKSTNVSECILLWERSSHAELILKSLSLKLLEKSWIDFWVVSRIHEKIALEGIIFSNFVGLLQWIYSKTLGEFFFQTPLACWVFKERMLNNQPYVSLLHKKNN